MVVVDEDFGAVVGVVVGEGAGGVEGWGVGGAGAGVGCCVVEAHFWLVLGGVSCWWRVRWWVVGLFEWVVGWG